MPIFYTDVPLAITQSGVVTVTSSVSAPVWVGVTGTLPVSMTNGGSNVTQGGGWTTQVSGVYNAPVWVTSTVAAPVQVASDHGPLGVSGSLAVTQGGALAAQVSGTVSSQQAGAWAVQVSGAANAPLWVTSSVSAPAYVQVTGALPVAAHAVTQGGAWASSVSGTVTSQQGGAWGVTVSGTVGSTQAGAWGVTVSGTVGTTQAGAQSTLVSGTVTSSMQAVGTATLAAVTVAAASTQLLAANPNRKGASIYAMSSTIYVGLGQTPTTSLFNFKMGSGSYVEVPFNFTGQVNAISAVAGNVVNVAEYTS